MNKIKNVWIAFTVSAIMSTASGQIVDRQLPLEWANLVYGGQFKDLFLPIPMRNGFTSNTWGGKNVKSRDVTNGIEDPEWSYWCGYPIRDEKCMTVPLVSDWFKFERIRFLQDEHGRPTHVHFAVTDIAKHDDLSKDSHNSKLIIIPMRVAQQLEMLNTEPITPDTQEICVKIFAEEGFDPHQDIQLDSLRYGASDEVNYGRGSQVLRTEKAGDDLLLVFNSRDSGITEENFAGKLLGKNKKGDILFGWSDLPGAVKKVPLLSPLSPKFEFTDQGLEAYVEVENFGEVKSHASTLKLLLGKAESGQVIATATVRPLMPFEKAIVRVVCTKPLARGSQHVFTVTVASKGWPVESFTKKVRLPRT